MRKPKYIVVLFLIMVIMAVIVGCSNNKALLDDNGKEVSLENKDNPTLIFFFTGNTWDYCKSQLVELQKNKELFANFPGDVYALSASAPEDHKELKKELGLDFTLLSDKYLTLIEEAKLKDPGELKSVRGFAILDKDGKVIDSKQIDPFGDQVAEIITFATEKAAQQ